MIFKSIYMDLDRVQFGTELGYSFLLKTRSLCGYIERQIIPLKYRSDGFNRIVIKGSKEPKDPYVNCCQVLCVSVEFDEEKFQSLNSQEDISEFLISMLKKGVTIGNQVSPLPQEEIFESIELFRSFGFKNEWRSKRRLYRKENVYAQFECHLSMESFELFLLLEKRKKEIWRERILKTDPDPVAYAYRYKDIVFTEDQLTVTSKTSQPLFTLNLRDVIHHQAVHTTRASARV